MGTHLGYAPHASQRRVHDSTARFRIVCCGRRWGKTKCSAVDILDAAGHVPGDYGWIAPYYSTTERGIDEIRKLTGMQFCRLRGIGPRYLDVLDGRSRIFFLSEDRPIPLRGYGFRGIVVDDAPFISFDTWQYIIRPTLIDYKGYGLLVGTPKGRNWFFDMYTRGRDPAEKDYESFTAPTHDNPYLSPSEMEDLTRDMPDMAYRQEILAEFLDDSAGVFSKVAECHGEPCDHSGEFIMGLDLAKHQDFTWAIIMCAECGACRAMDRFNKLDWPIQKQRIANMARDWNAKIIMDSTGVGDPIYDDLLMAFLNVEGVKITAQSKGPLIQGLMLAIEQQTIRWPADWIGLTDELNRYEYSYSPTGHVSYSAPSGYHDDGVIALALCVRGLGSFITPHVWGPVEPRGPAKTADEIAAVVEKAGQQPQDERVAEMIDNDAVWSNL